MIGQKMTKITANARVALILHLSKLLALSRLLSLPVTLNLPITLSSMTKTPTSRTIDKPTQKTAALNTRGRIVTTMPMITSTRMTAMTMTITRATTTMMTATTDK